MHFGDLFNKLGYPFIDVDSVGSIDGMIRFCETGYDELDEDTIVIPGHGVVTDMPDLAAYIEILKTVRQRVQVLFDDGKMMDEDIAANVTSDLDEACGIVAQSLGFINRVYMSLTK